MHDVGWGWWVISSIGMVAVWSLVIYGVFLLFRSAGSERPPANEPESPQDILKRRLAAGEIGVDEYERLRDALADDAVRHPREPALAPGARAASPSP
jgi:putative membrane protein